MRIVPDISHYQSVDWSVFDPPFLLQKCTQGIRFFDPTYTENVKQARSRGLKVAAYHFADKNDPKKEAEWFLSKCGDVDCYILDAESGQSEAWRISFLDELKKHGKPVLTYPCQGFTKIPDGVLLWTSRYGTNDGTVQNEMPPKTAPWPDWTMWQYTSFGTFPGVSGRCDLSLVGDNFLKKETMNEDFVKAVSDICGKDYGANLNDKEQVEAAKKIASKKKDLDSALVDLGWYKEEYGKCSIKLSQCETAPVPACPEVKVCESDMGPVDLMKLAMKKFLGII